MEMTIDNDCIPQGWQCPICKRVYSPTTLMCMYCGGGEHKTIATSTGIMDNFHGSDAIPGDTATNENTLFL